jgi:hypothetical protein
MAARKVRGVYQLSVVLRGISPPLWRLIEVWEDSTLGQLHKVLQAIFLWEDYHLHDFIVGRTTFSEPRPDDRDFDGKVSDERRAKLHAAAPWVGSCFQYNYDFGDDWWHDIRVEAILLPEAGAVYPRCVAGARSGPPEDVGGASGYQEYLEALVDPRDERHEEMLRWRGPFDPEAFPLDRINATLAARPGLGRRRAPELPQAIRAPVPVMKPQTRRTLGLTRGRKRIIILPGTPVRLELTPRDRELVLEHTFADEDLIERLRTGAGPYLYRLDELDNLVGFVASEANHTADKKLSKELDALYEKLVSVLDSYSEADA